ncbi:MAG: tRNA threonylcarbamoyladenosine dehydratase [Ruminococcaceae bacterium]|nr:tRNA threonylcarbamoyladenosine dehydratase [Oscillospiraceae bacterium]
MENRQRKTPEEFSRTAMLLGDDALERLMNSTVAVFGLGGVGGQCAEALCRAGVGHLLLVDGDAVSRSNINRQLLATQDTVGMRKTEAARQRLLSINPALEVQLRDVFYSADTADSVDLSRCDCIVDAIDTVTAKLLLIERAYALGVPVISCMGAGNKLDPSRFEAADIYKTTMCPLARVMRKELRKRGIPSLRVIYSQEEAITPQGEAEDSQRSRTTPGSASFCAPAAGLLAAAEAVRTVLSEQNNPQ